MNKFLLVFLLFSFVYLNGQDYVGGLINSSVATSDLFLLYSIGKGIAKGGLKAMSLGNRSWDGKGGYRSFYGKTGYAKKGQPLHHWFLKRNTGIGKKAPNMIKNQMWNLKPFKNASTHFRAGHGWHYMGKNHILKLVSFGLELHHG